MSHKLLVLGGKPIGSCELVKYAKAQGDYVVVADYLAPEASPAKRLADESWDASTADVDDLCERCREQGIDSVLSGVHEFNLDKMARVAQKMGYPCYCTPEQFDALRDKGQFKALCQEHGISTARRYSYKEAQCLPESAYPLAVKPLDGSGSRGFSKVANSDDLDAATWQTEREDVGERLESTRIALVLLLVLTTLYKVALPLKRLSIYLYWILYF